MLVEALPYIRRFAGQVVVVKYGGNALAGASDDDALALFAQDIVLMHQVGMRPVVVHGGGPQISDLMARLGKQAEFRNGLRVTDAETVDIVRMVLIGQVNPQLVSAINVHGPLAVGVSGEDAGLIRAVARDVDLGFVGDVESINPTILRGLLDEEFIPVVATIGTDAGGQAYNINPDTVAGAIAQAARPEEPRYPPHLERAAPGAAWSARSRPGLDAAGAGRTVEAAATPATAARRTAAGPASAILPAAASASLAVVEPGLSRGACHASRRITRYSAIASGAAAAPHTTGVDGTAAATTATGIVSIVGGGASDATVIA